MKCLNPYPVRHPDKSVKKTLLVPCGSCPLCLHTKRLQWVYRMEEESKLSDISVMLTFTYDNEHLVFGELFPSLDSSSFVKAIAKIKRVFLKKGIYFRYYGNGEYGDESLRPHYHLMSFFKINNYHEANYPQLLDTISEVCNQSWNKGHVQLDQCNFATMYYLAKYVTKSSSNVPEGSEQPRLYCSKHPYIGSGYLRKNGAWHGRAPKLRTRTEDSTVTARRFMYSGKYKIPLPRVYKRALYGDEKLTARQFEELFANQMVENLQSYKDAVKKYKLFKPTQDYDLQQLRQIDYYLEQRLHKILNITKDEY